MKKIFCLIGVIMSVCLLSVGCNFSHKNNTGKEKIGKIYHDHKHHLTVYPVKVKKFKAGKDGDVIIKGITNAPNGAKILVQGGSAESTDEQKNLASAVHDSTTYATVKNHHFSALIENPIYCAVNYQIENGGISDPEEAPRLYMKVVAVVGYHDKFDTYLINPVLDDTLEDIPETNWIIDGSLTYYDPKSSDEEAELPNDSKEKMQEKIDPTTAKKWNSLVNRNGLVLENLKKDFVNDYNVKYDQHQSAYIFIPKPEYWERINKYYNEGLVNVWREDIKYASGAFNYINLRIPFEIVDPNNQSKILYKVVSGKEIYVSK